MTEVISRGVKLHVQELGEGNETVIFLHGFVMDNLSSWYFVAGTRVAKLTRVVLYDYRGHGMSEQPLEGYTVTDMVEDLRGVIDGLGIPGPVHLVGNSFGGLLAVEFAARYPGRAKSLVVVDGHLAGPGWGDQMADTLALTGEERDRRIVEWFKEWIERHKDTDRKRNRVADKAGKLITRTSIIRDMRASEPISDEALARIDIPLLALYGETSDVLDHGKRLARCVPKSRLVIVANASHRVFWEQTARVRDEIVEFLGEQLK